MHHRTQQIRQASQFTAAPGSAASLPPWLVGRLGDPSLDVGARRALLASLLSDARAVPDHPTLRRLDDGTAVAVRDLMLALQRLDAAPAPPSGGYGRGSLRRGQGGRRRTAGRLAWRGRRDDGDDPPPVPAACGLPVRRPPDEEMVRPQASLRWAAGF
jgi:hypothetical protein